MRRALLLVAVLLALAAAGGGAARAEDEAPAGSFEELLDRLPPDRREEIEASIEKMTPRQRELMLKRFDELGPDQRRFIERAASGKPSVDSLDEREQRRLKNEERWLSLSEREREAMRQQLRDFQALSEEEQGSLVETHFVRRTPDRRRDLLNRLRDVPRLR